MNGERVKSLVWAVLTALSVAGVCGAIAAPSADPAVAADLSAALDLYRHTDQGAALDAAASAAVRHGADSQLLAEMVRRAGESGLSPGDLLGAIERVRDMTARDLPVSPILSRYLQGMAKGVPFARIEAVVAVLESRLDEAARTVDATLASSAGRLNGRARLDAVDHAAYALAVGVPEDLLDRSLRLVTDEGGSLQTLSAPVLTLGVLVASGVAPEKSLEVVDAAWRHGYRGSELQRLGESLSRLGGADGEAPSPEVVEKVLELIGNETDRDQFFRGLDELVGRGDDYRDSNLGPGDGPDPGARTRSRIEDPSEVPIKDRPEQSGGGHRSN